MVGRIGCALNSNDNRECDGGHIGSEDHLLVTKVCTQCGDSR